MAADRLVRGRRADRGGGPPVVARQPTAGAAGRVVRRGARAADRPAAGAGRRLGGAPGPAGGAPGARARGPVGARWTAPSGRRAGGAAGAVPRGRPRRAAAPEDRRRRAGAGAVAPGRVRLRRRRGHGGDGPARRPTDSFGLATWSASGDARLHLLFTRMVLEEGGLHGTPFSFQPEYQEALTALLLDTHGRGTLAPGALLEHDLRGVAQVSVALTVLWTLASTATLARPRAAQGPRRGRGRGRGLAAAADRAGAGRGAPRRLPADPAAGPVDPLQPDGARLAEHDGPHRRRGHGGRRRLRGRDPAAGVHVDAARRGRRGRRPAAVAARAPGRRPPGTTAADDGSRHRRRGGVLPVRAVPGARLRRHPRGDRVAHAGDGAAGAGARPAHRDRALVGDRGRRVRALPGRDRGGGRDHGVRRARPGGGPALELLPGEDRLDLDARRAPAPPGALRAPTGRSRATRHGGRGVRRSRPRRPRPVAADLTGPAEPGRLDAERPDPVPHDRRLGPARRRLAAAGRRLGHPRTRYVVYGVSPEDDRLTNFWLAAYDPYDGPTDEDEFITWGYHETGTAADVCALLDLQPDRVVATADPAAEQQLRQECGRDVRVRLLRDPGQVGDPRPPSRPRGSE